MKDINETLKNLKIEDFIWVIYIFLSILAIVSNYFERKYTLTKDKYSLKEFHNINTFIFFIILIIFTYFLYLNYKNIKELDSKSSSKKKLFTNLSFYVSILFFIGGLINLLTSLFDNGEEDLTLNFF